MKEVDRNLDGSIFTGEAYEDETGCRIGNSQGEAFFHDQLSLLLRESDDGLHSDRMESLKFSKKIIEEFAGKLRKILRENLPAHLQSEAFSSASLFMDGAFGIGASLSREESGKRLSHHLDSARKHISHPYKDAIEEAMNEEIARGTPRNQINAVIMASLKEKGLEPGIRHIQKATKARLGSFG